MWLVSNRTPYAAERSWIQDRDANKLWIVVVKATFEIRPDGSTRLADTQMPVLPMGLPRGKLGQSSLIYDSDLQWLKPSTDVLVNGCAWAPRGRLARTLDVELTLGQLKKRLRVFGDRQWERGIAGATISEPLPFEFMPIIYERAYGGWDRSAKDPADHRLDSRNPSGAGFLCQSNGCPGTVLPNIEYPDQLISSWRDRPQPAGMNAIDCAWSPRRELAGNYDEHWRKTRFPLWAEDFDQRYGQCAPVDQHVNGFLRGGERVNLVNLSPHGPLSFSLPRIYPFFQTRFGRERVDHRAQMCTVVIEPDFPRVIMTWQTSLVCNHRVDDLDVTVVTEKRAI
jgi:hypothetical protein